MKISEHFAFQEFSSRDYHLLTPIQLGMLDNLCRSILEPLRKFWGCPVHVSSGIRFPSDNNALRKQGYNPSETSDHLFGNVVKLRNPKKVKRFGRYYPYSVGASDIIPKIGAKKAFELLRPYIDTKNNLVNLPNGIGPVRVGQLIFEQWEDSAWIHVSNPVDLVYSLKISRVLVQYRTCFLISNNGGKSYEPL